MFITLEGIEGVGKTTLANRMAAVFREKGHEVLLTREPGGCELGRQLRALLLDVHATLCSESELFLFLADRAQHVTEVIRPFLSRGGIVICDRFVDSTIVYQGYGRGLPLETLQRLNEVAISGLWPDITFVLDMEPLAALRRARTRNIRQGLDSTEGRFEAEDIAFHRRIGEGFALWAKRNPERMVVLDATNTPDNLCKLAISHVGGFFTEPSCSEKGAVTDFGLQQQREK